jgi:coatomer protein complex subunit epsilon
MDPFSSEGELVNIHTAFIQGQYQAVLDDFDASDFSDSNKLPIQILRYRAQCALGQYDQVLSAISDSDAKRTPDLAAVKLLAAYSHNPNDELISDAETLASTSGDNLTVQLLIGTLLARAGKPDQAVALLSKHQGSLDAVALLVQIHLSQNRSDLALKEARGARSFAQDALLVNLAESWIGVRQGGENYQKAYYVFEELAGAPGSSSATSLVAQAVSELHLGRTEEAATALDQALALEPGNPAALANKVVLETLAGKNDAARELLGQLEKVDKEHEMLVDLAAKREAFQAAMAKYSPKFVA